MANNKETYSSAFKAKVALEALSQSKKNLDKLSAKYDVPVSVILVWAVQLERNASGVFEYSSEPEDVSAEPATVDVEIANADITKSIEQGVMSDDLNYKRLITWAGLGLVLVITFAQMLVEMFEINVEQTPELVVGDEAFPKVSTQKSEAEARLSRFGIVNDSTGIYSVPIEMAIEQMLNENRQDSVTELEEIDPTPVE